MNRTLRRALMLSLIMTFGVLSSYAQGDQGLFGMGKSAADYEYSTGESLMRAGEPNTSGTITNDSFGAPLGSGIAILLAAGAGYAIVRRKRSRKNTMLLLACVAVLGFTQCKKEEPLVPTNDGNTTKITLNVDNGGNDGSRVNVTGADVTFTSGDKILVAYDGKYVGTIEHNGTYFSGNITLTQNGTQPLYFYFLGNKQGSLAVGAEECTIDISNQTLELPVISMAPSDQPYPSEDNQYTARLHNKCALVKFNCPDGVNARVRVSGLYSSATVNFSTSSINPTGTTGTITLHSESLTDKWAILLPQTISTAPTVSIAGESTSLSMTTPLEINSTDYITEGLSITSVPALFTANGNTVVFSPGNLQATTTDFGVSWEWSFADNQYDFIGNAAANNAIDGNRSVSNNGTVDLFGWSTNSTYYGIHNSQDDAIYYGDFKDWGNLITDGGYSWRTMTIWEWYKMLTERNTVNTINNTENARYTMAKINTDATTVHGVIIFPDSNIGATPEGVTWGKINGYTQDDAWSTATTCTSGGWAALASKGCVFLPAGGYRKAVVDMWGPYGGYWSSSIAGDNIIGYFFFNNVKASPYSEDYRHRGHSVRLVRNVN